MLDRTHPTPTPLTGRRERPKMVRRYGCCRCQKHHVEGFDPLFKEHLMWQSKHGWHLVSENDVLIWLERRGT